MIATVIVLSFLLLLIAFRSIVVPLTAGLMNLLSVAAAYGILTFVFQEGHGAQLIGLDGAIPIVSYVPLLMFAILFGLSMDYQVFLLTRIQEHYRENQDNHEAVVDGLAVSARVITSAALIMVSVYTSFILNGDPTVKQFGLGLAAAIAVDATIVRCLLVPAVMVMLGRANWWLPRWLARPAASRDRGRRLLPGQGRGGHSRRRIQASGMTWRLPARELPAALTATVRPRAVEAKAAPGADQALVQDWGLNGFGSPSFVYLLYAFKLVVYFGGAMAVISLTPGSGRSATSPTGGASRSSSRNSPSGRSCGRSSGSAPARCRSASASTPDRRAALLAAARDGAPAALARQGAAHRRLLPDAGRQRSSMRASSPPASSSSSPAGRTWPEPTRAVCPPAAICGAARLARASSACGTKSRSSAPVLRSTSRSWWFRCSPRPVDRGLAIRPALHLVGRRLVEAQQALPVRRLDDGEQRAARPARGPSSGGCGGLPG